MIPVLIDKMLILKKKSQLGDNLLQAVVFIFLDEPEAMILLQAKCKAWRARALAMMSNANTSKFENLSTWPCTSVLLIEPLLNVVT